MKQLLLLLCLAAPSPAGAGYREAVKAAPGIGAGAGAGLEALLPLGGAELERNAGVRRLLEESSAALELFRQAASGDGRLAATAGEKAGGDPAALSLAGHLSLFRLLLISAKTALYAERPGDAEKDLLAAAGFIAHASSQRSCPLAAHAVARRALAEAYPIFLASLRGGSAAPAYMAGLARRLDAAAAAQDHMRLALAEEGEALKKSFRTYLSGEAPRTETAALPLIDRLLAERLLDDELRAMADSFFSSAVDSRVAAYAEAFAANDAGLAASLQGRWLEELRAAGEKYPAPGTLRSLKAYFFGDRGVKEGAAFGLAERFAAARAPDWAGLMPAYHAFYNALNVLRTGLAVKRFRRARGRLPASLGQLVPDYLPAVPGDTFASSAPLAYVKGRKSFLVYSVGPDRAGSGGRPALDLKTYPGGPDAGAGDIVFRGD